MENRHYEDPSEPLVLETPMKCQFLLLVAFSLARAAYSQGNFMFYNPTAPTHVGSLNGPLAGPGVWGQALVGTTVDSLSPLGVPLEHQANGVVPATVMTVPGVFAGEDVFVQMAAWDGTVWGASLSAVPPNQIGYTDVLSLGLVTGGGQPLQVTRFTTPAVVPSVPEPGFLSMTILGGMALFCAVNSDRCRRKPPL